MKSERIYDAITNVNSAYIDEASRPLTSKVVPTVKKWGRIAAVFAVIIIGISLIGRLGFSSSKNTSDMSTNTTGSGSSTESASNNDVNTTTDGASDFGTNASASYTSLSAPILPLTAENAGGITAERHVLLDYAPEMGSDYRSVWYEGVTDEYVLTNDTDVDIETVISYPFVRSIHSLLTDEEGVPIPYISIDGTGQETCMTVGGEFTEGEDYNVMDADVSSLLSEPVIVYELYDIDLGENPTDAVTVAISMNIDREKTGVLTYGFNGGRYDYEAGWIEYSFFARHVNDDQPIYLMVFGDDVSDISIQGYTDGSCDAGKECDATARYTSYTSTIGEMLTDACESYLSYFVRRSDITAWDDVLVSATVSHILQYVSEKDENGELYLVPNAGSFNMLEEIMTHTMAGDRTFWLSCPITIPAGESITVTAEYIKEPSYNFYGTGDTSALGYSLIAASGSRLSFTEITAEIVNFDGFEIEDQNFGFDTGSGITRVELNEKDNYYLNVKAR